MKHVSILVTLGYRFVSRLICVRSTDTSTERVATERAFPVTLNTWNTSLRGYDNFLSHNTRNVKAETMKLKILRFETIETLERVTICVIYSFEPWTCIERERERERESERENLSKVSSFKRKDEKNKHSELQGRFHAPRVSRLRQLSSSSFANLKIKSRRVSPGEKFRR